MPQPHSTNILSRVLFSNNPPLPDFTTVGFWQVLVVFCCNVSSECSGHATTLIALLGTKSVCLHLIYHRIAVAVDCEWVSFHGWPAFHFLRDLYLFRRTTVLFSPNCVSCMMRHACHHRCGVFVVIVQDSTIIKLWEGNVCHESSRKEDSTGPHGMHALQRGGMRCPLSTVLSPEARWKTYVAFNGLAGQTPCQPRSFQHGSQRVTDCLSSMEIPGCLQHAAGNKAYLRDGHSLFKQCSTLPCSPLLIYPNPAVPPALL
jgi:hypothetical protein